MLGEYGIKSKNPSTFIVFESVSKIIGYLSKLQ